MTENDEKRKVLEPCYISVEVDENNFYNLIDESDDLSGVSFSMSESEAISVAKAILTEVARRRFSFARGLVHE